MTEIAIQTNGQTLEICTYNDSIFRYIALAQKAPGEVSPEVVIIDLPEIDAAVLALWRAKVDILCTDARNVEGADAEVAEQAALVGINTAEIGNGLISSRWRFLNVGYDLKWFLKRCRDYGKKAEALYCEQREIPGRRLDDPTREALAMELAYYYLNVYAD